MSYDRAITVFSPDGHLFQVEYAQEAVKKGLCALGVKGADTVVLAVEKRSAQKLQDARTIRKILKLDDHVFLSFAGLSADARVLVNKARLECQRFRLNYEDPMDVDLVVRYIAEVQQKSTQSGGSRPYGLSTIVGGFNEDGAPQLWQTEPSGTSASWKAAAIGRNSQTVLEYMRKKYKDDMAREECIRFAVKSLLEVVDNGGKNIELLVMQHRKAGYLDEEEVRKVLEVVGREKDEEAITASSAKTAAMAEDY